MTFADQTAAYDVLVIGGGTAGMTAAKQVARAGKSVLLIEAAHTGGDCLYTGCVPSKALIASARRIHDVRDAGRFGIDAEPPRLDFGAVMDRKERIIAEIGTVDSPAALAEANVPVLHGRAAFVDAQTVRTDDRVVHGDRVILCTGSRPAIPPIPGLAESGYLTSDELMSLDALPGRLAVIGGGPTGLELGQVFRRLGSDVTIIERSGRVLRRNDEESAAFAQAALQGEGVVFHLDCDVVRVDRDGVARRLTLRRHDQPHEEIIEADSILVAAGRTARVDGLNLDAAEVATGQAGVIVDDHLRTTAETVWACGDVTGPPYLTHAAEDQARTAAKNALGGRASWNGRAIPWATFTDPEVAGVGLTEAAARDRFHDRLEVLTLPYDRIDRAVTDGAGDGFIKVLLVPGWTHGLLGGEVAGAHAVGANAGEIIQQFAFLMTWHLPAGLLAGTVASYPTYGLGARQAIGLHWTQAPESRSRQSPVASIVSRVSGLLRH